MAGFVIIFTDGQTLGPYSTYADALRVGREQPSRDCFSVIPRLGIGQNELVEANLAKPEQKVRTIR